MAPPDDVHSAGAWDDYWRAHLETKLMEVSLFDQISANESLIPMLGQRHVRRVLCLGSGLSLEPIRRADAGFEVDALDISTLPESMFNTEAAPPEVRARLRFVTGDLMDGHPCAGPYDAIIERRTAQLFQGPELDAALAIITARLAPRGLFLSHQHNGSWRLGASRRHFAQRWLEAHGFTIIHDDAAGGAERRRSAGAPRRPPG